MRATALSRTDAAIFDFNTAKAATDNALFWRSRSQFHRRKEKQRVLAFGQNGTYQKHWLCFLLWCAHGFYMHLCGLDRICLPIDFDWCFSHLRFTLNRRDFKINKSIRMDSFDTRFPIEKMLDIFPPCAHIGLVESQKCVSNQLFFDRFVVKWLCRTLETKQFSGIFINIYVFFLFSFVFDSKNRNNCR